MSGAAQVLRVMIVITFLVIFYLCDLVPFAKHESSS